MELEAHEVIRSLLPKEVSLSKKRERVTKGAILFMFVYKYKTPMIFQKRSRIIAKNNDKDQKHGGERKAQIQLNAISYIIKKDKL